MNEAAAIPEVFYTAYLNIFMEAQCKPGETVLVHAAASGVGTAAIQLCRAFDCPVIATASKPKLAFLQELGALATIDRKSQNFEQVVLQHTDQRGVNVILDPVGADYLAQNIACLQRGGRLVIIGLLGGANASISLASVLMKRLHIIGSVLRSRTLAEKEGITREVRERVWPLFESGELRPIVDTVCSIEDVEQAHDLLRTNATIGKVVLRVKS